MTKGNKEAERGLNKKTGYFINTTLKWLKSKVGLAFFSRTAIFQRRCASQGHPCPCRLPVFHPIFLLGIGKMWMYHYELNRPT